MYVYKYTHEGTRLELVHRTDVGDVPYAITAFPLYGKALIGVGHSVRIYDLGKKKLLKKCETKVGLPHSRVFRCVGRMRGDARCAIVRFFVYPGSLLAPLLVWCGELCLCPWLCVAIVSGAAVPGAQHPGQR